MASPIANYADLVWYLSEGIACFERSVFGTLLERQDAARWHHWLSCDACRGAGVVDAPTRRRLARGRRGGHLPEVGDYCPVCNGTGGQDHAEAVLMTPDEQRRAFSGDWAPSHEVNVRDEVLMRYAHVSRYLGRMPADLGRILVAAYEDERPRLGMSAAKADRLGLAADHPLRNGLAEVVMHARRVDAVHALLKGDRKTAAGYLWLAESWWNRICGKAVSW